MSDGKVYQGGVSVSSHFDPSLAANGFPAADTSSTQSCPVDALQGNDIAYSHKYADPALQKIEIVITAVDWFIKQKATIDLMSQVTSLGAAAPGAANATKNILTGTAAQNEAAANAATNLVQQTPPPSSPATNLVRQTPQAATPATASLTGSAQERAAQELADFKQEFPDAEAGDIVKLQRHADASANRNELNLSGNDAQSMHMAPQSAMRDTPGYNPKDAFTVLGPKEIHAAMDGGWKSVFQNMKGGPNQITAQQLFDTVAQAINKTPGLTAGEKLSLTSRLFDELFIEMKLQPGSLVRRPYSPR